MTAGAKPTAPRVLNTCIGCGYSLEGLPDDGACPECALPIARTRERSDLLRGADHRWLKRIRRGLCDLELAMKLLLACGAAIILFMLAMVIVGTILGGAAPSVLEKGFVALTLIMAGAAALLHLRACIFLALPTTGGDAASPRIRWTLLITGCLLIITGVLAFIYRLELATMGRPAHILIRALVEANAIIFFFALAGILRHYESRTVEWGPETRKWHAGLRRNIMIFIGAILIQDWLLQLTLFSGGTGGIPMLLMAIAYTVFLLPIMRVRSAIDMELIIGRETGGRAHIARRPPPKVEDLIPRDELGCQHAVKDAITHGNPAT